MRTLMYLRQCIRIFIIRSRLMKKIEEVTKSDLLSREFMQEVFDEEDEIERGVNIANLMDRARELKAYTEFKILLDAFRKAEREALPEKTKGSLCQWTNFESDEYDNMICGYWNATDKGILKPNSDEYACYHPILPVERLKNIETGAEQIKLAYKRTGVWHEIVVPKSLIASASKIVALAEQGVAVTSENAKLLVKYLSDVENLNDNFIRIKRSTSKFGWLNKDFIPFDGDIIFDGDMKFKQVSESVTTQGNYDTWLSHAREVRARKRVESKFCLAASFASVLVAPLRGLPFFVDLWGGTEAGKSVALMLAASVWANPDENAFIGDYKSTETALEAKADMLNHLPMLLDDTSNQNRRLAENFESLVYVLCSGKGKTRSNKDIGINRESRWKNCIITNGEKPLTSYVNQGGAMNRILEISCDGYIFEDPRLTASVAKNNYGYAGRDFIKILKEIGVEGIMEIQKGFLDELDNDEKMQKQSLSLSIVLTADKIATDYIFKDGEYIDIEEAKQVLIDKNEISDNERCYRFILDRVVANRGRFDPRNENIEQWGVIEDNYVLMISTALSRLCKEEGYSRLSFLKWANDKGLIQGNSGRYDFTKKINGICVKYVKIKILDDNEFLNDFIDASEEYKDNIPFN
nr:MAG TPA: active helicase ring shaped helicase [Caudoviricetes sp.]